MKVKINGYEVEGTPDEIRQLIGHKQSDCVLNYPSGYSYPDSGKTYPPWPTITCQL